MDIKEWILNQKETQKLNVDQMRSWRPLSGSLDQTNKEILTSEKDWESQVQLKTLLPTEWMIKVGTTKTMVQRQRPPWDSALILQCC